VRLLVLFLPFLISAPPPSYLFLCAFHADTTQGETAILERAVVLLSRTFRDRLECALSDIARAISSWLHDEGLSFAEQRLTVVAKVAR